MKLKLEKLVKVFTKTDGNCHICHGDLNFDFYGNAYGKDSWEIEHSKPRAKGGTDHLNNLFPAHVTCNRKKGVSPNRTIRSKYGTTRAPYSKAKKQSIKIQNTKKGFLIGSGIGLATTGPVGGVVGGTIGGIVANKRSPKK